MIDLSNFEWNKTALEAYDFKLVTWQDFIAADDLPEGLLDRANETVLRCNIDSAISYVTYDPLDNDEGFMLIGDMEEIAKETCEQIIFMEPLSGPLMKN